MDKFTEEEFIELQNLVKSIKRYIPKDKMKLLWNSYTRIVNTKEPQPCGCKSSANLWKKAFETVSAYARREQ